MDWKDLTWLEKAEQSIDWGDIMRQQTDDPQAQGIFIVTPRGLTMNHSNELEEICYMANYF
jgi:hypothetical protein